MTFDLSLFPGVNSFARSTPWLHGLMLIFSTYGVVVIGLLLVVNWWHARRSGSSRMMAGAAGILLTTRAWIGWTAAAAAALLAFSRVYIAAHYPHDVIAGLLLGAAISGVGFLACEIADAEGTFQSSRQIRRPRRPFVSFRTTSS